MTQIDLVLRTTTDLGRCFRSCRNERPKFVGVWTDA